MTFASLARVCWGGLLLGWAAGLGVTSSYAQSVNTDAVPSNVTIDEASATERAGLERVEQLLADGQIEEGVESLRRVMDADRGRLLPLTDAFERAAGVERWVTVRAACQLRVARWAAAQPAALELYRQRVDALAERWYRTAAERRDPTLLERLVEQLPLSRWGDDGLLALGDAALEEGDLLAARGAWLRISPALRTPTAKAPGGGTPAERPWWMALEAGRFLQNPGPWRGTLDAVVENPSWLAYPDTDLNLADVRARLVLVSILERSWRRAELELAWFRHYHGETRGKLAGREGPWRELLEEQLRRAREGAAASDAAARGDEGAFDRPRDSHAPWVPRSVDLPGRVTWRWPRGGHIPVVAVGARGGNRLAAAPVELSSPMVVGGKVVCVAGASVLAFDLRTGAPAFGARQADAVEPGGAEAGDAAAQDLAARPDVAEVFHLSTEGIDREDEGAVVGRLPGWVAGDGERVFAVLGGGTFRRGNRAALETLPAALVGLDLSAEGKVFLQIRLKGEEWGPQWQWSGAPVVEDGSLYAALQRSDGVRTETHVAAFDAGSGRLRWRRFVAASDARGRADAGGPSLVQQGRALFCATQAGAVACLEASDGRPRWLVRYPAAPDGDESRAAAGDAGQGGVAEKRPLVAGDLLFVAPTDSSFLYAFDANTGQLAWGVRRDDGRESPRLLGVAAGQVLASGARLRWFDVTTGGARGEFPVGSTSVEPGQARLGPRGAGRGLLVGVDVWWPTRDEILIFRQASAAAPSEPGADPGAEVGADRVADGRQASDRHAGVGRIDLRSRGATGGDLLIVGDVLLVHGPRGLQVLVGSR